MVAATMDRMTALSAAWLMDQHSLNEAWTEATKAMEPAISDLKAQGFCKNVQMRRVTTRDSFGQETYVGYEISAFDGKETKTTFVLFPMEVTQ